LYFWNCVAISFFEIVYLIDGLVLLSYLIYCFFVVETYLWTKLDPRS